MEGRRGLVVLLALMVVLAGFHQASAATSPARIISGLLSNALSALFKRMWSLTATANTVMTGRPMMKFESGYNVETVFDGSKLGIEPHSVEVCPNGDLLVLDSENSNIYRIAPPLSRYSRPKLLAGSGEGYTGHVDGRPREARMNHPKGFTVDDKGNIYVADTMNMAIRKISDAGVTTIAGGKWSRGRHVNGASEDGKLSNDFEVVYIGSSCSLLVVDRGNRAIKEIQLHFDDCTYQYATDIPLGIAVLFAAGFFGYMIGLLQRRVGVIIASQNEPRTPTKASIQPSPYQKPIRSSVRPPLIPAEDGSDKQEDEGLFLSIWSLFCGIFSSITEMLGIISVFRRKPQNHQSQHQYKKQQWPNTWPVQESFVISEEDQPPPVDARTPTPRKTYAFMAKDPENIHQLRHSQAYFNEWNGEPQKQQHLKHYRQYSLGPQTYFEQSCETMNEIIFGAVQESHGNRGAMEIKAVNYGDPLYDQYGLHSWVTRMGYSNDC